MNYDVATAFRPVKAGARFSGSVRFHNLKREELGALIWTLSWGGDSCLRHSLGMGKSLGMGGCSIDIDWDRSSLVWNGEQPFDNKAILNNIGGRITFGRSCMEDFQKEMDTFSREHLMPETQRAAWLNTPSMIELRAIANPANAANLSKHAEFPKLQPQLKTNHFRDAKEAGLVLPRTSEIISGTVVPMQKRPIESGNAPHSGSESAVSIETPDDKRSSESYTPLPVSPVRVGQIMPGILVPEPVEAGKQPKERIYFQPVECPEAVGNTGKRLAADGPALGTRWKARVKKATAPFVYELIEEIQ